MENNNEILNKATDCIQAEDYILAKDLLQKVIEADNDNIEAYKNLGLCEINLDNPPEAIHAFEHVLKIDENDALSIFYLATCKARVGEKEEAIKLLKRVIELRPDYGEAYKSIAMLYIEYQQPIKAIETIKSAIDNESIEKDYSYFYIIATAYMLQKDHKNASIYLEQALKYNPEHVAIMNSLAVCYMNSNQTDKVLPVLNKAYELDENNSLTIYNLGVYYQTLENYKKALEYFQKSYNLEPTITMLSSLANCAMNSGEFSLAATLYRNLVMAYPNNTNYRVAYIEALEISQDYKEALENVNLLLALDEKSIPLIKKKGTLLRKLKRNEESIATFNVLLNRGKIDVEIYYNLAFNYIELSDFDNGCEMLKKCITLEPNNPYAHKDLGVLYLKMNCYEWAVDEIEKSIELEDNVAEFHYSLGVAYMMLSKINEAKNCLLKATEIEPNNPDSLAYLGYIYLLEKENEKAQDVLQKALKIDPDNFLAKSHIAKYYFSQKKYDVAKEFLLDIVNATKDDETMNMLAICYIETNDYNSAMGILYKLSVKYPNNHIVLTNLAKCEAECLKIKEAKEHLRQALLIYEDYEPALELLEKLKND